MSDLRIVVDVDLLPISAFANLTEAFIRTLHDVGMRVESVPNGQISDGDVEIGRVTVWEPGNRVLLTLRPPDWSEHSPTELEIRFEPMNGGTRYFLEQRNWGHVVGSDADQTAWFADMVAAPLLKAMTSNSLGDWLTDRRVRRPSGPQARDTYRNPIYHRPNFEAILASLQLTAEDYLVEVGCGGGAFLEQALRSGCRAAAIDHSPDMVQLARALNAGAIDEGRLEIHGADAARLPFAGGTFTCAVMTGVFGFLPDPVAALKEIRRVLRPGGRLEVFTGSSALRGTPAAPEPYASRIHFYEDHELVQLAREAGFAQVRVEQPDLSEFARLAGVPEEALPLFEGPDTGGQLLLGQKPIAPASDATS